MLLDAKLVTMHTDKMLFKGSSEGRAAPSTCRSGRLGFWPGRGPDEALNRPQCRDVKNSAAAFVFFVKPNTFHAMGSDRAEVAYSSDGHDSTVFSMLNLTFFFEHPHPR